MPTAARPSPRSTRASVRAETNAEAAATSRTDPASGPLSASRSTSTRRLLGSTTIRPSPWSETASSQPDCSSRCANTSRVFGSTPAFAVKITRPPSASGTSARVKSSENDFLSLTGTLGCAHSCSPFLARPTSSWASASRPARARAASACRSPNSHRSWFLRRSQPAWTSRSSLPTPDDTPSRQALTRSSRAALSPGAPPDSRRSCRSNTSTASCPRRRLSPARGVQPFPSASDAAHCRDTATATRAGSTRAATTPAASHFERPMTAPTRFSRVTSPRAAHLTSRRDTGAISRPGSPSANCRTRLNPSARRPARLRTAPRPAPSTTRPASASDCLSATGSAFRAAATADRPRSDNARPSRPGPGFQPSGGAFSTRPPRAAAISTEHAAPQVRDTRAADSAAGPAANVRRPRSQTASFAAARSGNSGHSRRCAWSMSTARTAVFVRTGSAVRPSSTSTT